MTKLETKELDVGFIIISPDHNFGGLKCTYNSIKRSYPNNSVICITTGNTPIASMKEIKTICPAHKGKNDILSLVNSGMKHGHKEWNIFVRESAIVRKKVIEKYTSWIESEMDVLYPVFVTRDRDGMPLEKCGWFLDHQAQISGLMIHQKMFKEVGCFSDNPFDISRLWWAMEANDKGVKFKGILGTRFQ